MTHQQTTDQSKSDVYVIMGVSGSGKTTIGELLAERLDAPFFDGDDFHPEANVAKMSRGEPLNDEDRYPWLEALNEAIGRQLEKGQGAVFAVSALKKMYRDQLRANNEGVCFVYLDGSYDLILERMEEREGHFMKAEMLQSQFDALEIPTSNDAITVGIDQSIEKTVMEILSKLTQK